MKKIFVVALLCAVTNSLKAQYSNYIQTAPGLQYGYVGSLTKSADDGSNAQKIKVDVLGGSWGADGLGETTYLIGNRGGLRVNQVTLGGSNNNYFTLQAYDNGADNIDFYIVTNEWTVFALRSVMLQGTIPVNQFIPITISNTTPPGTPHALNILPVIITDPNGNMAFGTNNIDPAYKLSINGSIRAKEVKVETGWADYVFDKDYALKPLKEVKEYIDKNKHLPDVPSAAEVEKNGVKVGETEALLLKKIEELTLYLIEQQKVNRSLQLQIDALKKP